MMNPMVVPPMTPNFWKTNLTSNLPIFKVILVGDSSVGKTNVVSRFSRDKFNENEDPTLAVEFCRKKCESSDGKECWLHIWDTAGQERLESITSVYYRGSRGVFICFDVTNIRSYTNIAKWYEKLDEHLENTVVVLIGNKSDLSKRVVKQEDALKLCESYNWKYFETSAKTGNGIREAFDHMIKGIFDCDKQYKLQRKLLDIVNIGEDYEKDTNRKGCGCLDS